MEGRSRSIIGLGLSAELFRMDVLPELADRGNTFILHFSFASPNQRHRYEMEGRAGQRWHDGEAEIGRTDETFPC